MWTDSGLVTPGPSATGAETLNITLQLQGFQFLPWNADSDAALSSALSDSINGTSAALASTLVGRAFVEITSYYMDLWLISGDNQPQWVSDWAHKTPAGGSSKKSSTLRKRLIHW